MTLLSTILGQVMGVGVIALLIVFQQEIRRFFIMVGTKYFAKFNFSLENLFSFVIKPIPSIKIDSIVKACENMSRNKTGAIIIISNTSKLDSYAESGININAHTSSALLETIFFKNTRLHDGAVIITGERIRAARCVLPVSDNPSIPKNLGLRHRSAVGISETSDAFVIVVSEETGNISTVQYGHLTFNITPFQLKEKLENEFIKETKVKKRNKKSPDEIVFTSV